MPAPSLRFLSFGLVFFGGAAALAGLVVFGVPELLDPPTDRRSADIFATDVVLTAALSAVIPFTFLYLAGLRLRRGPLFLRAVLLGASVVIPAHLISGVVWYLVYAAHFLLDPSLQPLPEKGILLFGFLFAIAGTGLTIKFTLPLGIAAALAFEWLEGRRGSAESAKAAG